MKIKSAGSTLAAVSLAVIGLAACGGSDNDNSSSSPSTTADAFYTQVATIVATSPDNTEPVSLDAIVATTPENTEPAAVL